MNRWSLEREDKLRTLMAEGRSHRQIAEVFGNIKKSAVSKKCKNLGLGNAAVLSPWTDEIRVNVLEMRIIGLSSKTIAERLGAPFTRNSICGMLSRHQNASGTRLRAKPEVAPMPKPKRKLAVVDTSTPKCVPLEQAGFMACRWPLWDKDSGAPDYIVCGNKTAIDSSWCPHHAALVFSPSPASRARAKEALA